MKKTCLHDKVFTNIAKKYKIITAREVLSVKSGSKSVLLKSFLFVRFSVVIKNLCTMVEQTIILTNNT